MVVRFIGYCAERVGATCFLLLAPCGGLLVGQRLFFLVAGLCLAAGFLFAQAQAGDCPWTTTAASSASYLLCMTSARGVSDLKAMLSAVRIQIELLEGEAMKSCDKELRKRIKKLKGQESVILSKLGELTN